MSFTTRSICWILFVVMVMPLAAQTPQDLEKLKRDALAYKPVQKDVTIDQAAPEDCDFTAAPPEVGNGYLLTTKQGIWLRLFLDTTGKGRVDRWSYFRDGVEVYRDMDTNGNGIADQCRYFHAEGTRWGVDANEDGVVDAWQKISAEDVAWEVLRACYDQDSARLARVALTPAQLQSLELGKTLNDTVAAKLPTFSQQLQTTLTTLRLTNAVEWFQFVGNRPALVPAGREGNKRDLLVYENALVIFPEGDKTAQLSLGTLVDVGNGNWRLIDLPMRDDGTEATLRSTFVPATGGAQIAAAPGDDILPLIRSIQEVQTAVATSPKTQQSELYDRLVVLYLQVMQKSAVADRDVWCRQLADLLMTAIQRDGYTSGVTKLVSLQETATRAGRTELVAYIRRCRIMSEYYQQMASGENALECQIKWLAELESLATEAAATETGSEVALEIAYYSETAGENDKAMTWYNRVAEQYPGTPVATRATGALRRLNSVGRAIQFQSKLSDGKQFDLAALKGAPVLLYFWDSRSTTPETWNALKRLQVRIVGIAMDYQPEDAMKTITQQQLTFPMIVESGGIDGASALYWGVSAAPLMILVDGTGKVAAQSVESLTALESLLTPAVPAVLP